MPDTIKIQILEDGTIRSETGKVSAISHASAEAFLREQARLCGGTTTRTRKAQSHSTTSQQQHQGN